MDKPVTQQGIKEVISHCNVFIRQLLRNSAQRESSHSDVFGVIIITISS